MPSGATARETGVGMLACVAGPPSPVGLLLAPVPAYVESTPSVPSLRMKLPSATKTLPSGATATLRGLSMKPDFSAKSKFKDAPKTTIKLTNPTKVEPKKEQNSVQEVKQEPDQPFTPQQLQQAWHEFAEQRKKFQAEYQLLSQPYELDKGKVILPLHNPVQEMMLSNLRVDLTTFLRDKLRNQSINVIGELREADERKVIYTNREKFDYLVAKNPILKEFKDRLGLDTDF